MRRLLWLGVRMRWTITRNTLRRRGRALFTLTLVACALGALGGFATLTAAGVADADIRRAILLFTFTLGLIAWMFGPLLMGGADETVDPAPLALLSLTRRQLAAVMAGAAVSSPATLAVAVALLGTVVTGVGGGAIAALVSLLTAASLFLLGLGASRSLASVMGLANRTRRGRDISVIVVSLTGVALWAISQSIGPILQAGGASNDSALLRAMAATPPGWAARAVLHCRVGNPAAALPWTAAVLATAIVLLALWARLGARLLLHTSSDQRSRRRATPGAAWPRTLDARGAALAKEWRYQWRSPMRRTQAIIGVALSVGFAVLQTLPVQDPSPKFVYAGLMGLLFSANNAFNVVGFDSHSLWLEFSAAGGLRRHQLEARLLSYGAGTMVGLVLAGLAVSIVTGAWSELGFYLALAPTGVLCLLGVGAVVSASWPLTAIDGDNPFKKPAGANGCGYALAVLGAMGSLAVLLAPIALPLVFSDGAWRLAVVVVGWGWGWAVWRVGVGRAVRRLEHHGPDLLAELAPRLGT